MGPLLRNAVIRSPRSLTIRLQQLRTYSSTPSSLITTETHPAPHCGCIKVLSLNRPEARNAISRKLLSDLRAELSSLSVFDPSNGQPANPESVRALIIASNVPGVFCAGADLKERISFSLEETRAFLTTLRETFSTIASLPIPTISAIAGPALGGGLELGLATTFRVATSTSKLALPETRLAIIPGGGGTFRLPAVIGRQRALQLVLTGRALSAMEAEAIGLVDRVVLSDPETASEAALKGARVLAEDILRGGPIAVNMALKAVKGWKDGGQSEAEGYEAVLQTQDRLAALKAFKEKGTAKYTGS